MVNNGTKLKRRELRSRRLSVNIECRSCFSRISLFCRRISASRKLL